MICKLPTTIGTGDICVCVMMEPSGLYRLTMIIVKAHSRSSNKGVIDMNAHHSDLHGRMRDMSDLELVRDLIRLFETYVWIQGTNACTKGMYSCSPTDDNAIGFCLRGAAIKVLDPDATLLSTVFIQESEVSSQIPRALGFKSNADVIEWNDVRAQDKDDVLALLHRRLERIPYEMEIREREMAKERAKITEATAAAQKKRIATAAANRAKESADE